jgi:hypothetical protein
MNPFWFLAILYAFMSGFFYREYRQGLILDKEHPSFGFAGLALRHLKPNICFTVACLVIGTVVHFTTV